MTSRNEILKKIKIEFSKGNLFISIKKYKKASKIYKNIIKIIPNGYVDILIYCLDNIAYCEAKIGRKKYSQLAYTHSFLLKRKISLNEKEETFSNINNLFI